MVLNVKRLLNGTGKSTLNSCDLLGLKKSDCKRMRKKARKIKHDLIFKL